MSLHPDHHPDHHPDLHPDRLLARVVRPYGAGSGPQPPLALTRRQLLQVLGIGSAAAALGACGVGGLASPDDAAAARRPKSAGATPTRASTKRTTAKKTASKPTAANGTGKGGPRTLVVIELSGGHDGFAMLVPTSDPRFRKLRDRIWVDPKDLHPFDGATSIAKGLAPVAKQLSFVEGVGVAKPDLSHFAMLQRWWAGDPDGTRNELTGFLGRCCDVVHGGEPVTGVSVGGGATPALISTTATTVSLPHLDAVREFTKDEPDQRRLREALTTMAGARGGGLGGQAVDALLERARHGLAEGLTLSSMIGGLGTVDKTYPENNDLATSLASIRQLVSAGSGVRIFHVPWGSFDTHSNEVGTHTDHMNRLGAALAAFRDDLATHGLSDRVLVATTSEFGRRAEANQGGTDHGTASTMLLMGPLRPGRHGTPVDFGRLDDTGNVRATVGMSDYYTTLATWLGARPSDVLPSPGSVIDSLLH